MTYQVTARKWRPMVFEDVVGQSHVTSTLQNAIATNRVAHAYIFSGTRGCGKTSTARILAKALNCVSPVNRNPDNTCEICQEITNGRGLDVIEIDGASNRGVEEIRNLRESVRYTPTRGKYKIYIIDEVHMLTKEAFNALLKTLEEPPAHVVFIFATTEVHKVPMTILSRCQRFDFRRIAIEEIIQRISYIAREEGVAIDEDALMIIAKKGDGSLRDAQSIFDQVRSFCGNEIKTEELLKAFNVVDQEFFFRVTNSFRAHDAKGAVELVDEVLRSGYDLREFVGGMAEHLRNFLIVLSTGSTQLIETSEPFRKRYQADAQLFTEQDILRFIKQVNELEQAIRWAPQPRYKLEAALLQMVKMESSVKIENLLQQIDELKKKLSGSNGVDEKTASAAKPSNEIKVVGEVSAGRLRTSAAMSYSSLPAYAAAQPSSFGSPPDSTTIGANQVFVKPAVPANVEARISAPGVSTSHAFAPQRLIAHQEVVTRWPDFVSDVLKSRIAVGTTLRESELLDVNSGMLRIACPDDYHFSTLKRHKEFLADTFHRITGSRIIIEPVLHKGANPARQEPEPESPSTSDPASGSSTQPVNEIRAEEHPLFAVLRRELGAEKVE